MKLYEIYTKNIEYLEKENNYNLDVDDLNPITNIRIETLFIRKNLKSTSKFENDIYTINCYKLIKDSNYDLIYNNYIGLPIELNHHICKFLFTKIYINLKIGIKFINYYSNFILIYELLECNKNINSLNEKMNYKYNATYDISNIRLDINYKLDFLNNYTKNIIINNVNFKILSNELKIVNNIFKNYLLFVISHTNLI